MEPSLFIFYDMDVFFCEYPDVWSLYVDKKRYIAISFDHGYHLIILSDVAMGCVYPDAVHSQLLESADSIFVSRCRSDSGDNLGFSVHTSQLFAALICVLIHGGILTACVGVLDYQSTIFLSK